MKITNIFSSLSLLISNLIPVYGVLFWNWKVFPILITYWLENAALLFWNAKKINKCVFVTNPPAGIGVVGFDYGDSVNSFSKKFLTGFFIFHYGVFTFVHGIFLFTFFGLATKENLNLVEIFLAFVFIFISHGISYQTNFIGKGEFRLNSASLQMFKPYGRVVVMHLVISLGASIVLSTGSSVPVLLLLVGMKIIIDLASHLFEHKFQYGRE